MHRLTVRGVFSDAWDVYRLLFKRSIAVALAIYALIYAFDIANENISHGSLAVGLSLLGSVLSFAGPILVQGALVKIVRSVHEGTRPASAVILMRDAGDRIVSLVGASLLYALGVIVGLLLFIVPGLVAAARMALMAPAIMLEGLSTIPAERRSNAIVRGQSETGLGDQTWFAVGVVVSSWLLTTGVPTALSYSAYAGVWDWAAWVLGAVAATLFAPYQAHILSVLYYRLVDPHRPAIDPRVRTWSSVWAGAPETA